MEEDAIESNDTIDFRLNYVKYVHRSPALTNSGVKNYNY